jgi:hypothetical protein
MGGVMVDGTFRESSYGADEEPRTPVRFMPAAALSAMRVTLEDQTGLRVVWTSRSTQVPPRR